MVTEDRRSRRLDLLTGGVASRHSAMLWPALHDYKPLRSSSMKLLGLGLGKARDSHMSV